MSEKTALAKRVTFALLRAAVRSFVPGGGVADTVYEAIKQHQEEKRQSQVIDSIVDEVSELRAKFEEWVAKHNASDEHLDEYVLRSTGEQEPAA
ncbi:MAG: hypothetical protein HY719_03960 [Planctomycetes bacterium]|nr:hypothetical protein [Planctomycetota bacterium]